MTREPKTTKEQKKKIKIKKKPGESRVSFYHDYSSIEKLNPDYAIAFVMSGVITKKSGYLETEAQHRYVEVENSNEVADFVRRGG